MILSLGHETVRRRSELLALRFEDIDQVPRDPPNLRLNFSKIDNYSVGKALPTGE